MDKKSIMERLQAIRKDIERLLKVDSYTKQIRKQRLLEDIDEIIITLNQ